MYGIQITQVKLAASFGGKFVFQNVVHIVDQHLLIKFFGSPLATTKVATTHPTVGLLLVILLTDHLHRLPPIGTLRSSAFT